VLTFKATDTWHNPVYANSSNLDSLLPKVLIINWASWVPLSSYHEPATLHPDNGGHGAFTP
jgi:hypothetical protein